MHHIEAEVLSPGMASLKAVAQELLFALVGIFLYRFRAIQIVRNAFHRVSLLVVSTLAGKGIRIVDSITITDRLFGDHVLERAV